MAMAAKPGPGPGSVIAAHMIIGLSLPEWHETSAALQVRGSARPMARRH
jgi:hypothetical protein